MEFIFEPILRVDRSNVNQLTPLQREQLLVAGAGCYGKASANVEELLAYTEVQAGWWKCYRVSRADTGATAYDVWTKCDENGTVFFAGTTKNTEIVMVDGYLINQAGGHFSPALFADLSRAWSERWAADAKARVDALTKEFKRAAKAEQATKPAAKAEPAQKAATKSKTTKKATAKSKTAKKAPKKAAKKSSKVKRSR